MLTLEPIRVNQALHKEKWVKAMIEELPGIDKHKVWSLMNLPLRKKIIDMKWIFKLKGDEANPQYIDCGKRLYIDGRIGLRNSNKN